MTRALVTVEQLERAIADDDAAGFEHDGDLSAWLGDAGILASAGVAAGAYVIRNAPIAVNAGRRAQLEATRTVLAGVRIGLRLAELPQPPRRRAVTEGELASGLAAARALIDETGGDVYEWLHAAGLEPDALGAVLGYALRVGDANLIGQHHLAEWFLRPEGAITFAAGLIAGLQLGRDRGAE